MKESMKKMMRQVLFGLTMMMGIMTIGWDSASAVNKPMNLNHCCNKGPSTLMDPTTYARDINGDPIVEERPYRMYISNSHANKVTTVAYTSWAGSDYPYANTIPPETNDTLIVRFTKLYPSGRDKTIYKTDEVYLRVDNYSDPERNFLQFGSFSGYPYIGTKPASTHCPECLWRLDRWKYEYFPILAKEGYANGIINNYLEIGEYASRLKADKPTDWLTFGSSNRPSEGLDYFVFVPV